MYEAYLKAFLELMKLEGVTGEQVARRIRIVLEILSEADKSGLVTEEMFMAWSELLLNLDDAEGVVEVLSKAVDAWSTPSLCERYLSVISQITDNWETLCEEFEKCIKKMDEKGSLAIWELWMNTCTERDAKNAVKVFEMSLSARKQVAELGRQKYLEWAYERQGIKEFRKLFKRLKDTCPLTLDVLQLALSLENSQETKSLSRIRKLHELAIDSFGTMSIDCWLEYISFELEQEETAIDTVGSIYWRALKMLESHLVGEFIDKYTLLKTTSSASMG
ncbi:U3 small nucleolar RNA-associated protein 6 homolog [Rhopilema esculentum]|uniref:U3 small nucleolar RNA-associated protein 6 homolog n=1 Tax=Rhopilema esculentum TaxID=499914 RepID=UPI0031D7DF98